MGLDKNKKYILIAGGSMGGGGIKKAIKKLYNYSADKRDTELIVICGSNKALYDKLIKKSYPNITNVTKLRLMKRLLYYKK